MRTRIKICGITNADDLDAAIAAGVDAVGFNMFAESPRYVDPVRLAELSRRVPPLMTKVGLFVNHDKSQVRELDDAARFDLLQFHGEEEEAQCLDAGKPYMKALRISAGGDAAALAANYPNARAFLLDALVESARGGTGETFDWRGIGDLGKPFFLAGGLDPDNVDEAIEIARPYAVDVSSGVESGPGKKDPDLINAFVSAVRRADEGI